MSQEKTITKNQLPYLLGLHRGLGLSSQRFLNLKQYFENNFEKAFNATKSELKQAKITPRGIDKFLENRSKISPQQEIDLISKSGAEVLIYGEKNFPIPLENIPNPPVMLFVKGQIKPCDFPNIAVVGSRKIGNYGKRVIETLISEISQEGITITSGLAFGADALAHTVALQNNQRTLAILGNGIDTISPRTNIPLAKKILENNQGAIISEFLPQTETRPENFPIRNRIIAGLAKATIIIEAQAKSGTLITARLANEMGREVFAVPGEIFTKNSSGTNNLLVQGVATPALSADQILTHLNLKQQKEKQKIQTQIPTSAVEADILKIFATNPKRHIDDIFRLCSHSPNLIASNLVILEMKGLIHNLGNQNYAINI